MNEPKNAVTVIGHKNPDTDSICSAIAYANLKKKLDPGTEYTAARAGRVNQETRYVLDYFGLEAPEYLSDVRTQIRDIQIRSVEGISRDTSLKKAWERMKGANAVTLPVTRGKELEGIITIKDIVNAYMEVYDREILALARTPYGNLLETLEGEMLMGDPKAVIGKGKIIVGAGSADVLEEYIQPHDIVILSNRSDAQFCAIEMGADCIIVCNGASVSRTTRAMAQKSGCSIISTKHDSYSAARLINQSAPVGHFMKKEEIVTFKSESYIDDVKKVMAEKRHRDFPVLDRQGRYTGMISRRFVLNTKGKKLILVDHNEKGQAVEGIGEAEILEIIDHHRLASIETMAPVFFRNQPVGCTATIIYQMYREAGLSPDPTTSGLLCAAILSDTLLFRSPTCTAEDRWAGESLAKIAGIDLEAFAGDMFRAGSSLSGKSAEEIFFQDFKTFTVGKVSFGVGQISSLDKKGLAEISEMMDVYMKGLSRERGLDMVCLMLTDIIDQKTELLFEGEQAEEILCRCFGKEALKGGAFSLPGVVSRKKQLIPSIISGLQDTE